MKGATVKLVLVEPATRDRQWFRTADGRFDVLGSDLSYTDAASRAAGAGPVWSWRPAKPTRDWSNDMHHFTSKPACLADLRRHIATEPPTPPAVGSRWRHPLSGVVVTVTRIDPDWGVVYTCLDPAGNLREFGQPVKGFLNEYVVDSGTPAPNPGTVVACPQCGQKNRIPGSTDVPATSPFAATSARCAKCKRVFLAGDVVSALMSAVTR